METVTPEIFLANEKIKREKHFQLFCILLKSIATRFAMQERMNSNGKQQNMNIKNIAGMLRCNCYFLWGQNFDCQSTKYLTMISACLLLSNNDSFIPSPKTYTHAQDRARIVYICILAIMFREAFSHRISFA